MPKLYFKKSLIFNPVRLKSGAVVKWNRYNRADGVVETDNEEEVAALKKLSETGALGVKEITKEEFEELKKKPILTISDTEWTPKVQDRQELFPSQQAKSQPPQKGAGKPVAAGKAKSPISEPTRAEKPVTTTGVFDALNNP